MHFSPIHFSATLYLGSIFANVMLAHVTQLGPLRATESAEIAGCMSAAGLVLILTLCLSIYGAVSFQGVRGGRRCIQLPRLPVQLTHSQSAPGAQAN